MLNIGSADNIGINDLAAHVVEATGADVTPVHEAVRGADARHTDADVTQARECLGYDPTTNIRDGVERFVDWYPDNREW